MAQASQSMSSAADPRWEAFRSPQGPEVFHSVVSPHDVWKADPFDVEDIHAEAREAFGRLLERVAAGQTEGGGRILLLRGESGSGKTHLMRAFRHLTHARQLGWLAYLQMTTNIADYPRYILRNTVDSLNQPYNLEGGVAQSGLQRLSDLLAAHPALPQERLAALREGDSKESADHVFALADCLNEQPAFARAEVDLNLLRALLFLQRCEPAFSRRVVSYLRCEAMTNYDSAYLGEIPPRSNPDDPPEMLAQLSRAMAAAGGGAFVLCVDQLEDAYEPGEAARERFRNSMKAIRHFAEPNAAAIVVIACLDEYWTQLCRLLDPPLRERIDEDPRPVRLQTQRNAAEVEKIVARRLAYLYEDAGAEFLPQEPVYPFAPADLALLGTLRARGILQACHQARERSVRTGARPLISESTTDDPLLAPPQNVPLEQRWNDFRNGLETKPPEKDAELISLLAWAIEACNAELNTVDNKGFSAKPAHTFIQVDAPAIPDTARRWLIGLCNGRAPGGKLSRQIADLTAAAGQAAAGRAAVAVRSTEFPGKAGSQIARQIGELVKQGGRRAVIEDGDWRAMFALREFLPKETDQAALAAWCMAEKPLSRLPGVRALLLLDKLPIMEAKPIPIPAPDDGGTTPVKPTGPRKEKKPGKSDDAASENEEKTEQAPVVEPGPLTLGQTRETSPKPVQVPQDDLTRHAAFLGSAGSGKTTLAMALIEHLLLRGIPAILLDRKGDLAAYARPESWTGPLPGGDEPNAAARRARLRERVDIQLFTPGDAAAGRGRPLGISLLPRGVGQLPGPERELAARTAASSLGAMINYKPTGATAARLAILGKAIAVLAEVEPDADMTLDRLAGFIADEDASLVSAIGRLETRLFKKVVNDLETFRINQGSLLASGGERVNAEMLLGLGAHAPAPGKTRLSIISTKFFSDQAGALFWIAQFLQEIGRHAARHPSGGPLQAVVLLDEADLYLPATGKMPPTKEPMENALRRWRSAGIGVLLASQSPGDFDYKCRDQIRHWFVGKVQQETAISKMRPMLKEARTDIAAKLPALGAGQFFLVREGVVESLQSRRSLVAAEQLSDEEILRLAVK